METWTLTTTAATIAFVHTIIGPDHYIPFVAMSKARNWSVTKTTIITILCGVGHVASSVILGFLGIAIGLAVAKLEGFEGSRGDLAAWLLTAFGLAYMVWGLKRAYRNKPHTHSHLHGKDHQAGDHDHEHTHTGEHLHPHEKKEGASLTPWVLFAIFVFGPCEPLIPILMFPAARQNMATVWLVVLVFAVVTIATMVCAVLAARRALSLVPFKKLERYGHALAGFAILVCGILIHVGL